jgi:hypothetical protein
MKVVFRGWRREVKPHIRNIVPVSYSGTKYRAGTAEAPLKWHSALTAYGRLDDLGLSGRFLVEMKFDLSEMKNWIERLVDEQPETALRLLTEMQGKAVKAVLGK